MTPRIDPAEYALGLLDGADLAEARRLEATDPAFAAEVGALTGVGARLNALEAPEWDQAGPPPLRVDTSLTPAPAPPPRSRRSRTASLRERLGAGVSMRPAFAAACAVVLLGIGVGAGLLAAGGTDGGSAPAGQVVALTRFDSGPAGASGRATVSQSGGGPEVTIDTRGLRPTRPGSSYEVWMIRDGKHMVGLGRFKVGRGGRATVTLPVVASPADYPIMDVSIQADDGPAAHSGISVLRSPSAAA